MSALGAETERDAPEHGIRRLFADMVKAALGPGASFIALFALPLVAAKQLPTNQFAMWSVLSTVATVSLTLDFGGNALVMAHHGSSRYAMTIRKGALLSAAGSAVVGFGACVVWLPYSRSAAAQAFGLVAGLVALGMTSVGGALRSYCTVVAQAGLQERMFALRSFAMGGQPVLYAAGSLVMLMFVDTAWVLPVSFLGSALLAALATHLWALARGLYSRGLSADGVTAAVSTRKYSVARTAATVMSALMLQGDRWVVGAVGGPQFLAAYEIAWRVASLPRFVVQNFAVVAGARGRDIRGAARPADYASRLLHRTVGICAVVALATVVVVAFAYGFIPQFVGVAELFGVFAALCLAMSVNGLSGPVTNAGLSVGIPTIDLPFLGGALACYAAAAGAAALLDNVDLFVYAGSAGLLLTSAALVAIGPRAVRRHLSITGELA